MTVFSVQRFLEDHLERRGLTDVDDYAIRAANLFERVGATASQETIARELGRIHTAFFRRNQSLDRRDFEIRLAATLRRRFQKKKGNPDFARFRRGLGQARVRLRTHARSITSLLSEFKKAVEARAIDTFWVARRRNRLRSKPEKIAQGLLAVFAKAVVGNDGIVIREVASGIGFVDVAVSFGGPLHLIELKILKGRVVGASQLATYMSTEGRPIGWLVLVDVRLNSDGGALPAKINVPEGLIKILRIYVNPRAPHLG